MLAVRPTPNHHHVLAQLMHHVLVTSLQSNQLENDMAHASAIFGSSAQASTVCLESELSHVMD